MKPTTSWPFAICIAVAAVHPASAQLDTSRASRSTLAVAVGGNVTEQRDATASPLPFDGRGYQLTARYAHSEGSYSVLVSLDGGRRRLTSRTPATAVEDLTAGEFRLSVLRALGRPQPTSAFAAGVSVARSLDINAHHYADPTGSVADFIIGSVTAGPEVTWQARLAGGSAKASLSTPVAGFVDHPYSDERAAPSRIHARFATVSKLRGVSAAIAYAPVTARPIGVEYAYRLRVLRYDDLQPVRSVSQSLSIGIVAHFGATSGAR